MTTIPTRQPKGIPVGGQFSATAHAEPATVLTVDKPHDELVEDLLVSFEKERVAREAEIHSAAHDSIIGDTLSASEEARVARAAIHHSLISGEFGKDTAQVRDLAADDRLVRLAVDRYAVTESQEPGAFRPEVAGHRLGRILVDLQDEDIEDGVYAHKGDSE